MQERKVCSDPTLPHFSTSSVIQEREENLEGLGLNLPAFPLNSLILKERRRRI